MTLSSLRLWMDEGMQRELNGAVEKSISYNLKLLAVGHDGMARALPNSAFSTPATKILQGRFRDLGEKVPPGENAGFKNWRGEFCFTNVKGWLPAKRILLP